MHVLISGAGIAGLTMAFWLHRHGHEITIVEKSPSLCDAGYMIDFYGSGYDVAEKMNLLPDLEAIHYPIPHLAFIDEQGRERYSIRYTSFRSLLDNRHFNFMRGDLEKVLYEKVKDNIQMRFGTTVSSFQQCDSGDKVQGTLSDGSTTEFDLLIGADGLHSQIRKLGFGDESQFERFLGYYTAAFILPDRLPEVQTDKL